MSHLFQILALLSAFPCAYLAFRKDVIKDLKSQMQDLKNESGIGNKFIPFFYQLIAYLYLGKRENWIEIFNPTSTILNKIRKDKTTALRAFLWFLLAFIFTFISIILSDR